MIQLILFFILITVFFGNYEALQPRRPKYERVQQPSLSARTKSSGGHGEGFHFIPMIRTGRKDHFPRIIQIAGVYPDITPDDLLAPPQSASAAPKGTWSYDFSDVTGVQLGKVAIPGSEVITDCVDPVVLITTNTQLGIACPAEVEMLVVVDRGDCAFNPDSFYAIRTPENTLKIQWMESISQDMDIMGKVVVATVPFVSAMLPPSNGFAESGDDEDE